MRMPRESDKLFLNESNMTYGAWLQNPANKFFLYSEGYKHAGNMLFEICTTETFYQNILVYPLVFNYRQYIELKLKELILVANKFEECEDDFPDIHNLNELWKQFREITLKIDDTQNPADIRGMNKLIAQFTNEDPESMHFRYPVSRGPNRNEHIKRDTIDLENFKVNIDRIVFYLESQWDMIVSYQEMKDEMIADAYSNYF